MLEFAPSHEQSLELLGDVNIINASETIKVEG